MEKPPDMRCDNRKHSNVLEYSLELHFQTRNYMICDAKQTPVSPLPLSPTVMRDMDYSTGLSIGKVILLSIELEPPSPLANEVTISIHGLVQSNTRSRAAVASRKW